MKRIIKHKGKFKIESKTLFGWRVEQAWLGCDLLGFDYGFGDLEFETLEDVEEHLIKNDKGYKEVLKYV